MPVKSAPPRRAANVDHAVVYRRENEFASHPYVRGFWETAAGHLITNFSVATVDYQMVSLDAGVKYQGLSLEAEYYRRRLTDFKPPDMEKYLG